MNTNSTVIGPRCHVCQMEDETENSWEYFVLGQRMIATCSCCGYTVDFPVLDLTLKGVLESHFEHQVLNEYPWYYGECPIHQEAAR